MKALILKAGSKLASLAHVPGDFEQWIAWGMGVEADVVAIQENGPLPALKGVGAIAITGSAAMVTDRIPWVEEAAGWLRDAVALEVPILGICFGHQLLAYALGGEVAYNVRGVEVGTVRVRLTPEAAGDPLFAGLPAAFSVQASHRQSVVRLPRHARLLAAGALDPHQAFAFGRRAWGVQFHPEFDASITRAYVDSFRPLLAEEGKDFEALRAAAGPSPESIGLLARFAAVAGLRGDEP